MTEDTTTITVGSLLGQALIACGAAVGTFAPATRTPGCPYAAVVRQLANAPERRSHAQVMEQIGLLKDLAAEGKDPCKTEDAVVQDGNGVPVEVDRTTYEIPGFDSKAVIFRHPREIASDMAEYLCVHESAGTKTLYCFSRDLAERLGERPLAEVVTDALKRERTGKRRHHDLFEDNGCAIRVTGPDGEPLTLVRYSTARGVVYATGPLSLMPLCGYEAEITAHDLGEIREPGGRVRMYLCDPGDTGRMEKVEHGRRRPW